MANKNKNRGGKAVKKTVKIVIKKRGKEKKKTVNKVKKKSENGVAKVIAKTPKYCPICGKVFVGKTNNLTRHIREQHSPEKELVLCPICPYSSQWKKNIRAHCSKEHADKVVDLSDLKTIKVVNQGMYIFSYIWYRFK